MRHIIIISALFVFSYYPEASFAKSNKASTKKMDWGYKAFPVVEKQTSDYLPYKISIGGREQLRARLRKGSGTHPQMGIEQLYTDRSYKKRVHVKKMVQVHGKNVVGGWRQVAKGHVLHLRYGKTVTAYYTTGLTSRERFYFESNVRKYHRVADFTPFMQRAYAEVTGATGGEATAEQVQDAGGGWDLSSMAVAAQTATCYLARGGENLSNMAQGALQGARDLASDPGGAWQRARAWAGRTVEGAVDGAQQAWENRREIAEAVGQGIADGARAVRDGATTGFEYITTTSPGEIWEDIGEATDNTVEYMQRLGEMAMQQIEGLRDLPDHAKAQILCELAIQATGEGIASAIMTATGVGAALAVPRIAAFFARMGRTVARVMPRIREIAGNSDLSQRDQIQQMRAALRGDGGDGPGDVAPAAATNPNVLSAGQQRAAERLGLSQEEYAEMLSRNMDPNLPDADRLGLAREALGRELTEEQTQAVIRAHEAGTMRPDGTYSREDLLAKREILRGAGLSDTEIETLMDRGITGALAAGEARPPLTTLADIQARAVDRYGQSDPNAVRTMIQNSVYTQGNDISRVLAGEAPGSLEDVQRAFLDYGELARQARPQFGSYDLEMGLEGFRNARTVTPGTMSARAHVRALLLEANERLRQLRARPMAPQSEVDRIFTDLDGALEANGLGRDFLRRPENLQYASAGVRLDQPPPTRYLEALERRTMIEYARQVHSARLAEMRNHANYRVRGPDGVEGYSELAQEVRDLETAAQRLDGFIRQLEQRFGQ